MYVTLYIVLSLIKDKKKMKIKQWLNGRVLNKIIKKV